MGIYDRDYYRQTLPRGGFGYFSAWSVTTWLIIANIAVFFLAGIVHRMATPAIAPDQIDDVRQWLRQAADSWMGPIERWGYFSINKAIFAGQIWRFITFQFLHASIQHVIGNMLGLFFFGPIVEAHFGSRRYLAFYLLCGLAGAFSYIILSYSHILHLNPATPLVGASAGVFGLLVAAAIIAPHVQVFYYFFPLTIGMLAIGGLLVAAYTVFVLGPNAGGEAGHLGGAALGFLLMKNQHWLTIFAQVPREPAYSARSPRPRKRTFQKDWSKDMNR